MRKQYLVIGGRKNKYAQKGGHYLVKGNYQEVALSR
jgi:hypothetical protein